MMTVRFVNSFLDCSSPNECFFFTGINSVLPKVVISHLFIVNITIRLFLSHGYCFVFFDPD